jgi:pimeloyl-ACP methyl ester carboxylesterase
MTKLRKRLLWGLVALAGVVVILAAAAAMLVFYRVEGQYFEADGLQIHYTDEGSGPVALLIHGFAAQADWNWRWPGIVGQLKRAGFRVIMFDLRGHGLSDKPHDPGAYGEELAKDVIRVLDAAEVDRAIVAGYSLGGFIALKAVCDHPERFIAAAYCASGWADPSTAKEEFPSPFRPPPPSSLVPRMAAASGDRTVSGAVDAVRDMLGDLLFDKQAGKACKKAYPELAVSLDTLQQNTVPGICLIGDRDGLLPMARDMEFYMPQLEFVLLHGANHIDTPAKREFKRTLLEFFLEHKPASP